MSPLLLLLQVSNERVWSRFPAPGIEYRSIVQTDPPRTITALRFEPGAPYRATSALAGDTVYESNPANGRSTMSEEMRSTGAIAGVNGDFFQWGNDPGGDPQNLMVREGELISHPIDAGGSPGGRACAYGWGRDGFVVAYPSWVANSSLGAISALNSYTIDKGLTLSTAASGYAISKEPATFLVLSVGPKVLTPRCTIDGTVIRTVEDVERLRVSPGQMVLSTQSSRESLRRATPGQKIRLRVDVKGFDWKRVDNVMGGGPPLLAKGVDVAPSKDSFATTRHPRTAVGRDAKGGTWLVVIDGRQVQSVGASLPETSEIMRELGCVDAINLDGGGSSTLSLFGTTLNHLAGSIERGVANVVLFHGPSPSPKGGTLTIQAAPLKVGEEARMAILENGEKIADNRVVWTAQGNAWIDGDGVLHPTKAGDVTVRALVDGRTVEAKLTVNP